MFKARLPQSLPFWPPSLVNYCVCMRFTQGKRKKKTKERKKKIPSELAYTAKHDWSFSQRSEPRMKWSHWFARLFFLTAHKNIPAFTWLTPCQNQEMFLFVFSLGNVLEISVFLVFPRKGSPRPRKDLSILLTLGCATQGVRSFSLSQKQITQVKQSWQFLPQTELSNGFPLRLGC